MRDTVAQTRDYKTTNAMEIESLKRRVKKLKRKKRSITHGLKWLYKVVKRYFFTQQDEKVVEKEVDAAQIQVTTAVTTPTISIDEATLAQPLTELKNAKPKAKAKGIVFHEPEESTTTVLDEEVALKLQAELQVKFDKEQRLAAERAQQEVEANIALIESWDDAQAKIDADYQLKRRKFFAAKRAEEKRNKPPTQAQQRKIMCTYLKNMEGKKLTDLKNKSFDSIQKMFDRAFKRVNTFVDYRTELVEQSSKKAKVEITHKGSSKRAGDELEQERSKKQKVEDD
uniref:Uncharacterized protein n=1 Tax=Tanacetum cinerariifolium TaxID=118510 RepID=A0A6L2LLD6_TANCI|nr:hypothetical protein [Tanacetum cinerariifolium]